ncbi:MAG: YhbY family RNA-binding protein [Deltaproteobacteria bacterium]|nr:YhbY family RNA-binding protein [Deltaproteobacteria bacterium]MBW2420162.1 YhbY family RNA-binding protein [Deltaproteobacteria bacterium]
MSETTPGLLGFQRKHLRKLAHGLDPVVYVGEAGISAAVVAALDVALRDHELVKVKLRQPTDKKAMAATLAERGGAELCGLVGHTVILFRPDSENPRIELPARPAD